MNKYFEIGCRETLGQEILALFKREPNDRFNVAVFRQENGCYLIDWGVDSQMCERKDEQYEKLREICNKYWEALKPVDIVC